MSDNLYAKEHPGGDPGQNDDEQFGLLADEIDLVDASVRERLGGGELERRRQAIMDQVAFRNVPAADLPAGTVVVAKGGMSFTRQDRVGLPWQMDGGDTWHPDGLIDEILAEGGTVSSPR